MPSITELVSEIIDLCPDSRFIKLIERVVHDFNFQTWTASGSPDKHHYGKHGLLLHTHDVIGLCMEMCGRYNVRGWDKTNLYFAALYHDIGKVKDYKAIGPDYQSWEERPEKSTIYHISQSHAIWYEATALYGYPRKERDPVSHAILAHHGHREWGSPVEPQTKIAHILHLCDSLSARCSKEESS